MNEKSYLHVDITQVDVKSVDGPQWDGHRQIGTSETDTRVGDGMVHYTSTKPPFTKFTRGQLSPQCLRYSIGLYTLQTLTYRLRF